MAVLYFLILNLKSKMNHLNSGFLCFFIIIFNLVLTLLSCAVFYSNCVERKLISIYIYVPGVHR